MLTANLATLSGFGLIIIALTIVMFSPYRRWFGFMVAGMFFWGLLELVRYGVQSFFDMPVTYSYLIALSLAMLTVTLVLLREDQLAQKALKNRQYIEHTPVYDDKR